MAAPPTIETDQAIWRLHGIDSSSAVAKTEELGDTLCNLVETAATSAEKAYAPYSKFRVGSAVLTESGNIHTGCNIENASYGATMCAERVAIYSAVVAGETGFNAIALCTLDSVDVAELSMRSPCGLCRQVMSEFFTKDTLILIDAGKNPAIGRRMIDVTNIDTVLPWRFKLD